MKIFLTPGTAAEGSAYLEEILHSVGLCFTEKCSLPDALQRADATRDVIVLSGDSDSTGIETFLRAGGSVVAIQPDASLARIAGLQYKDETNIPTRLRLTQPVCHGARGEPLWTLGSVRWYEPKPGPDVIGYLYNPDDATRESIGILESRVGNGSLVVYAYDPALCVMRLRQGLPERANYIPPGLPTPRAIFLQQEGAPADTLWRPTADLHAYTLAETIQRMLARYAPVPRLWPMPDGKPTLLIFSGDEDGSQQEENDYQMREIEEFGGAMSLYVIPDNTSITRERIENYTSRGHTISVHPNLVPASDETPAKQLEQAEKQLRLFHDLFGQPVRTLRNHCYMWPGYVDLPELWERLGVGMDANACATQYGSSLDLGPYARIHGGIPLRYVRENGALIDVFQQPTHFNDDLATHPTKDYSAKYSVEEFDWQAQRILDDAIRYFNVPLCANFHPCNYIDFSGAQGRVLLQRAHELGIPIWSLDHWHNFWRDRSSWQMGDYSWNGVELTMKWSGEACNSLVVTLPSQVEGSSLSDVQINGASCEWRTIQQNGRSVCAVDLPNGCSKATLLAIY